MLGHSDHRVCKTGLLDVAWLLPTMGHTAEGTDVVRLGYAYAHDAALLEAILHAERRVGDSQKRLEYAWRGNYNRFHELHALCTVDPPTVAAAIVGGYVDVARALLAKGAHDINRVLDWCAAKFDSERGEGASVGIAALLRELCAHPHTDPVVVLTVSVNWALLDLIASSATAAFVALGYPDFGEETDHVDLLEFFHNCAPVTTDAARALTVHPFFSLRSCFELAIANPSIPAANVWVAELCTRLEADADTVDMALHAAAVTGSGAVIAGLLARGAKIPGSFCTDITYSQDGCLLEAALLGRHAEVRQLYRLPDPTGNNLFACVCAGLADCAADLISTHNWAANDIHYGDASRQCRVV